MKTNSFTLGVIALIIVIIAAIGISALSKPNSTPATKYQIDETNRPRLQLNQTSFDIGRVKKTESKTHSLTIKNIGQKPLDIRNFSTSCGCTSVEVKIGDRTSPRFSMYNNPPWKAELEKDQSAQLLITYDPTVHPVKGAITRTVYFQTNDPENLEVEIKFNAFVE